MEINDFPSYLEFLRDMRETLDRLIGVEKEKTAAVRRDDLEVLDLCMKQEQALSLNLRGLDQRREAAMAALKLEGTSLSMLPLRVPEELRGEAKTLTEELLSQYQLFQSVSEVARDTLECNLHQIERVLGDMGGTSEPAAGYGRHEPELPRTMRTDFRA